MLSILICLFSRSSVPLDRGTENNFSRFSLFSSEDADWLTSTFINFTQAMLDLFFSEQINYAHFIYERPFYSFEKYIKNFSRGKKYLSNTIRSFLNYRFFKRPKINSFICYITNTRSYLSILNNMYIFYQFLETNMI